MTSKRIVLDIFFEEVSLNETCTIELSFTHQWWDLGLYWATWGLPYTDIRDVKSLRTKYAIVETATNGRNVLLPV